LCSYFERERVVIDRVGRIIWKKDRAGLEIPYVTGKIFFYERSAGREGDGRKGKCLKIIFHENGFIFGFYLETVLEMFLKQNNNFLIVT